MIRIAVSGFFSPIHRGHLSLFREAKLYGYELEAKRGNPRPKVTLIVIVNNDAQVRLKGSIPFMNEWDRAEIIRNIKDVDKVFIACDEDESVALSLERIRPDVFVNSGDRDENNAHPKEMEVCNSYGIMIQYIKSPKVASSSELLHNAINWHNRSQYAAVKREDDAHNLLELEDHIHVDYGLWI